MKLYNYATNDYAHFAPPSQVRIYTCGITPYDSAHLGHILTFMTYDLLQRRLEDLGHSVHLVRNITDVDEPIFARALHLNKDYRELASEEIIQFQEIMKRLNFRPAFAEPRASEYILPMAEAVEQLLKTGFAYHLEEDVYFDVSTYPQFGSFSRFSSQLQLKFMKRRGGDPERSGKRQPLDFLLWRGVPDPEDPAAWETVLGRGRPGWHIECSIMSAELLGTPFDLHGGGNDLIFPHHECEIAQTAALHHAELAHHWTYVAPLVYLGEKMSKSLGNLVFAVDLLKSYKPAAIRLALLHYHYREGGEWVPELLDEATALLQKLYQAGQSATEAQVQKLLERLRAALDDDLDTHDICHALRDFCDTPADRPEASSASAGLFQRCLDLLGLECS